MYKNDYATVAASQTKQVLSAASGVPGNTSNFGEIENVVIVPATTSPGLVEIYDETAGTAIVLFAGGATSVADLKPIWIKLGIRSRNGRWCVTTGANVSAIFTGRLI